MGHVLFHYCNFRWDIIISFPATTFLKRAGLPTSMRAISPPWATLDTICTTLSPFFSLWHMGCDATWLDGCTGCNNCCDLAPASVTFSNFELTHARDSDIPEVREAWLKMHPEEN